MTGETNIVVLFKTFEDLQRDEDEIVADFQREWDDANAAFDLTYKTITADEAALTKWAAPAYEPPPHFLKNPQRRAALNALDSKLCAKLDAMYSNMVALAATQANLKKEISIELTKREAVTTLDNARKAALAKCNERMFGLGALARRSRRFASAQVGKSYGAGATSLPPAS